MRGAIHFHRPAGQQQSQNDNQKQLLLLREPVHGDNVTVFIRNRNNGVTRGIIYDLRFTIYAANYRRLVNRKSNIANCMAAIGRFRKGDDIFHAKVVDGELFRLRGDVFGSPSFDRKPIPRKGLKTLVPVVPSKIICVGLNYADHAHETGKELRRSR